MERGEGVWVVSAAEKKIAVAGGLELRGLGFLSLSTLSLFIFK